MGEQINSLTFSFPALSFALGVGTGYWVLEREFGEEELEEAVDWISFSTSLDESRTLIEALKL